MSFLQLVIRGFLWVLGFPPLLRWLMVQPRKYSSNKWELNSVKLSSWAIPHGTKHDMLHVMSARCVARDLHTIVPRPVEHTCWRSFAAQWGDSKKSQIVPLNVIIIMIIMCSSSAYWWQATLLTATLCQWTITDLCLLPDRPQPQVSSLLPFYQQLLECSIASLCLFLGLQSFTPTAWSLVVSASGLSQTSVPTQTLHSFRFPTPYRLSINCQSAV